MSTLTREESRCLPWFRVVAANGVVSTVKLGSVGRRQIARLRAEGIGVTAVNKVEDFKAIAWFPGRTPVIDFLKS
jgi:alkylated DNA nucleotide flippase Atl1